MTVVWDADQGSSLSWSLLSRVVGWIDIVVSLFCLIYLSLISLLMFTLVSSSNNWSQSVFSNVPFVDWFVFVGWWSIDVRLSLIQKRHQQKNFGIPFLIFCILSSPILICLSRCVIISLIQLCCSGNNWLYKTFTCVWGQYLNWHIIDMWFVTYAYEVKTSIACYIHVHMLHLHMRSIPQFLCIWYAICVVCVRGKYLYCVLGWPLFWMFSVGRGYMPWLRISIT